MASTWHLYVPLGNAELSAVEEAYRLALAAFAEEHRPREESTAPLAGAVNVPRVSEVSAAYKRAGKPMPPLVAARLKACKRGLTLEGPPELGRSRLQVSALRFLLRRAGLGLMDWGDGMLQPVEEAIQELARHADAGPLGVEAPPPLAEREELKAHALRNGGSGPQQPELPLPESEGPAKAKTAEVVLPELPDSELRELTPPAGVEPPEPRPAEAAAPGELASELVHRLREAEALLERLEAALEAEGTAAATEALRARGELLLLRARVEALARGVK